MSTNSNSSQWVWVVEQGSYSDYSVVGVFSLMVSEPGETCRDCGKSSDRWPSPERETTLAERLETLWCRFCGGWSNHDSEHCLRHAVPPTNEAPHE